MEKISKKAGKLATLVLGAAFALSGCGRSDKKLGQYTTQEQKESRINDHLSERINEIAVYQTFKGRVISYNDFSEITGIQKTLPKKFYGAPLWTEVRSYGELEQSVSDGRVRIDIPQTIARDVLAKLVKRKNDYLGIKPLTDKDFENLPVGGY